MDITTDGPALVLAGQFDVRSTMEVRAAIYQHLHECLDEEIFVDLTDVDAVDVTALKVLAVATRSAERDGPPSPSGLRPRRPANAARLPPAPPGSSEEHTSELQSLMRTS